MAFMVPVVKNEWDIYGSTAGRSSARSAQTSAQPTRGSRPASVAGHPTMSRGPSFGTPASLSTSPAYDTWRGPPSGRQSRSSSRASNASQVAISPTARAALVFGPRSQPNRSPPKPLSSSVPVRTTSSSPGSGGFHSRMVDKLMRVLNKGDSSSSRKS